MASLGNGLRQGNEAAAEGEWNSACERISVGCAKYQDADWLRRIRRCAAQQRSVLSLCGPPG